MAASARALWTTRVAALLGDLAWYRRGKLRDSVDKGLCQIPELGCDRDRLSAMSRQALRSRARIALEESRVPFLRIDPADQLTKAQVYGTAHLQAARAAGRGCVLAVPRMGNWRHGLAALASAFDDIVVVGTAAAKRDLGRALDEIGVDIWAGEEGSGMYRELTARLRGGAIVCMFADRAIGNSAIEVTALSRPARFPGTPAALALRAGAALTPAAVWYQGAGNAVCIHDEIRKPPSAVWRECIRLMTQQLADVFDREIRGHPQDWLRPLSLPE